jgi:hypothetical protein
MGEGTTIECMPPLQDIPRLPGPRPAPVAPPDIRMTLAELHSPRPAERDRAVDAVRASPEHYPPPVLYALALALFQGGSGTRPSSGTTPASCGPGSTWSAAPTRRSPA